jgi:hypothetical protein
MCKVIVTAGIIAFALYLIRALWAPKPKPLRLSEKSLFESFEEMRLWGEQVFGDVKPRRIVARSDEEMTELKDLLDIDNTWTDKAVEEAADVVIILTRAPGLAEAIERKMEINRARKWNLRGDGTGYHIPQ